MGFIKYIAVFDDEAQMVLSTKVLDRYRISAYPAFFVADGKPYYSSVNAESSDYAEMLKSCTEIGTPDIPVKVFMHAYQAAYDSNYFKVVVMCPHAKLYPYYKAAVTAANRFNRHKNIDFSTFEITVIDSKAVAVGPMLQLLELAHNHDVYGYSSTLAIDVAKRATKNSKVFILSKTGEDFTAYRIFGNTRTQINLSNSNEYMKYDDFVEAISVYLKKDGKRYAVSFGCNCDFAGNIIGRINEVTDKSPVCSMKYGIASAAVLGDQTVCIHIL